MNETVSVKATPYPTGWFWFLRSGDSWTAPTVNNGLPYLPDTTNQALRNFYWFCRNPCGYFMGFVIGCEGFDYSATGPVPVMQTTLYDAVPPQKGWHWSVIAVSFLRLPFVSYSGKYCLWYLGWRPSSGGFGFKFNIHAAI